MYLSNRDIEWAIACGRLIIDPKPERIDETSVDLHLDTADKARVWDIEKYNAECAVDGKAIYELCTSKIKYKEFSRKYHTGRLRHTG